MNPKFIKVDTVGVDQPVLEGAYKLLRASAVPIVIADCYCGTASICFGKDGALPRNTSYLYGKILPFQLFLAYLEEVLRISDRVLVMDKGILAGELNRDQLTEEVVMHLAAGTT